ncbi:MAG: FAD-dependent oxidoreductase, partial [Bacteroidales bacterium]
MKPILVIGGGISGVTTAVEIAEVGKEVILIEKNPYLGGNVVKFNRGPIEAGHVERRVDPFGKHAATGRPQWHCLCSRIDIE